MTLTIFLFIAIIIAGIQTTIPFLVNRSIIFGVTIPENYLRNETLLSYKKKYSLFVSVFSLILLTSYLLWALFQPVTQEQIVLIGTFLEFAIILFSFALYFYFHGKTMRLKKINHWTENLKNIKVADLSARAHDEMLPWQVYLLPMIITVGVMIYTTIQYDLLPQQIPTHWGVNGEPDAFTEKTMLSVLLLPLTLLIMQLMFLGLHVGTKKSGIKVNSESTEVSRQRQLTLRKYSSWFMFFISMLLTMLISYFQLQTIHPTIFSATAMFLVPLGFLVLILVSAIVFAVKVGLSDKKTAPQIQEKIVDSNEDSYWKGGLFYFNKNDPSIFVEKRFGIGWTINFANPLGYLIVFLPLIAIILFTFLAK
ncbi:membrane protein [Robertmurraya siralis]|uniref:Membrane protein n=1 Tax=Robertmurraya siralis TaxID=77777 RepID=A0A920BVP0_9BACI|nr:DUF5808 domain-containing protein [Robertmurraya siralis]PAE21228.1 hypothetical protein CHH80_07105 [Bacillus sp. 7504-2]GIN63592.1 membrane protein [Robertmurraya siralis]